MKPEKKPLTVTFYSGKLWHSDKPFPVVPKYDGKDWESREYRNYLEDCKVYKYAVPRWLSTAYEVVNPLDIPGIEPGVETDSPRSYNMKNMVDGYEFSLPEGYEMQKGFNNKSMITLPEKPTIPVPIFTAAPGFMTPSKHFYAHYKDGKFVIPPITTVEPSESQEETQKQIWDEVVKVHGSNMDYEDEDDLIKDLMEKFTITRK